LYFKDFIKVRDALGSDVRISSSANNVIFLVPDVDQVIFSPDVTYTYKGEPCENQGQSYWTIRTTSDSAGTVATDAAGEPITETGPLYFEWLDGKYLPEMRARQKELAAQQAEN
jgi:hypothetical protein